MTGLLCLLAVLLTAGGDVWAKEGPLYGAYRAEVLRVIDGDTVEMRVRIWLGQDVTTRVRLRGVDAPERRAPCAREKAAAEAARRYLTDLLSATPTVVLTEITQDAFGGRVDAHVALPTGEDVGANLIAAGHARPWPARSRCD